MILKVWTVKILRIMAWLPPTLILLDRDNKFIGKYDRFQKRELMR